MSYANEVRTLVYDALNNAWEGGYNKFIIENSTDAVAADLAATVDGIEQIHPELVRQEVNRWKADKAKQVGEF